MIPKPLKPANVPAPTASSNFFKKQTPIFAPGVAPELLQQERSLQQQLDALEKQRIEVLNRPNHNPAQQAELEKQRQTLIAQYQDIQAQIRITSPRYAALTQPQPLTLAQI